MNLMAAAAAPKQAVRMAKLRRHSEQTQVIAGRYGNVSMRVFGLGRPRHRDRRQRPRPARRRPTGYPGSPIAGMPVLRVWEAHDVIVFKRPCMAVGYAGVANPLLYRESSQMLFGGARDRVEEIVNAL